MQERTKKRLEVYFSWATAIALAIIILFSLFPQIPLGLWTVVAVLMIVGIGSAIALGFSFRREIGW